MHLQAALSGIARSSPLSPSGRCWLLFAALGTAWIPVWSQTVAPTAASPSPEGTLERHSVVFAAPEEACASYLDTFRIRIWQVGVPTPVAFAEMLNALPLTAAHRAALLTPDWWSPNPAGGFDIRPSADFLRELSPAERASLYALLARWEPNKPERWPLVFPDQAALARLQSAGLPPALLKRVAAWLYPFPGGLAFSDFSLLAEEFTDRDLLIRFLAEATAKEGIVPRLRLRQALSVGSALAYWTVDNNNPFARPMLEALLHAETDKGIELTSLFPGAVRVLSHDISPEQVRHDASLLSLMISSSLSGGPQSFEAVSDFEAWFDRNFVRVTAPYRFGDLMMLEHPAGLPFRYACAYIAGDLAFAKDPVGLGLWGFMPLDEILRRNPHFAGGSWAGYRRRALATMPVRQTARLETGVPGPWGVLRTARIELEPPDRWLDVVNVFQAQSWEFAGEDWSRIETLLRSCQLTPAQLEVLLNPALRTLRPNGNLALAAPAALRRELSATSRALLSDELGSRGNNPNHYIPLVLPADDAALENAGLNPALCAALRRFSYQRRGRSCLSDADLLVPYITDQAEGRRLKGLLFAAPALQVELCRESLAYRAEVVAYWKKTDGRAPAALLDWFEHSPDLEAIDVLNFLPPIPQQTLYTFPENDTKDRTNCFWTGLNFFAHTPDNRFLTSRLNGPAGRQLIADELSQHYHPIKPPYRFGDVLCYVDARPDGFGYIHMMNYVADGIVLTKNGFSALAPTILMHLDDVAWRYPTTFDLEVRAFRRNGADAGP
jgi:hypothetical protein